MAGQRSMPQVLALPLERATLALEAAGWQVRVTETAPPGGAPRGLKRVVRQRRTGCRLVELTAAAQIELVETASVRDQEGKPLPQRS